ncbi:unnamed protein product [Clavelina lepadiformis]|uniref:Major facilitator superfamily (MFS) profile domain-containing protein n=1 Tax=Clavelina lepadiformis TaxID=159417 RepID=A0ABP0GAI9_CLALP
MFAPTKVAALWFPDNQRALANTIATSSNPLGIMTANILSPVIVKTPKDILTMLIVYACPAVLGAILVSAGVRQSRPSLPPSASAETEPEPFWMGIKKLLSNRQYWLIFLCIGGGIGIYTAITVFLEQMLCPWGYEDFFAGVVCGTCLVLGGVVGGLIAGVIADRTKRFTLISKLSYFFCIGSVAFFTFIHNKRSQEALIALSCALIGFFGLPLFPLGNELVVETTYPVEVATSSGLVFLSGQLQGMLLILVLQKLATPVAPEFANITKCHSSDSSVSPAGGMTKPIPIRDMTISSYALFGYSAFVCLIFLVFFRTTYRRRNMEQTSSRRKSYLKSADILEDNDVGNVECISPNFDSKNAVDVRRLPSTSLDDSSAKTSKSNF